MSGTMFGQQQDPAERERAVVAQLKRAGVVPEVVVSTSSPTTTTVVLKDVVTLTKMHDVATHLKDVPFVGISTVEGRLTVHCSVTAPRASKRRSCDDEPSALQRMTALHADCKRADMDPAPVVGVASVMRTLRGTSNEEAFRSIAVSSRRLMAVSVRGGVVVSLRSLLSAAEKSGSRDGAVGVRPRADDASESMLSTADFLPFDDDSELLGIRELLVVVVLKAPE